MTRNIYRAGSIVFLLAVFVMPLSVSAEMTMKEAVLQKQAATKARKAAEAAAASWAKAEAENTLSAYRRYVQGFPQGEQAVLARQRIKVLEREEQRRADEAAWAAASNNNEGELLRYLRDFPSGRHVTEARQQLARAISKREKAEELAAWQSVDRRRSEDYRDFLARYPDGRYAQEARRELTALELRKDQAAWERVNPEESGSIEAYLAAYPEGQFAVSARQRLVTLAEAKRLAAEDDAFWGQTDKSSLASLERYLARFPQGRSAVTAQRQMTHVRHSAEAVQAWLQVEKHDGAAVAAYLSRYPAGPKTEEAQRYAAGLAGVYAAGALFKDCIDCPSMVVVPAGRFIMGSPASEPNRSSDEGPQHEVTISRAFAVGQYEVTFAEWEACVEAGGCSGYRQADKGWGRGQRPVINVSWEDAQGYVQWLSRKTGKTYRLLSEAEWEYVARAGTTTPFWTGNCVNTSQANYDGNYDYNGCGAKTGTYREKTVPVGSFAPNAFGLYDTIGNVWEWVQDCYVASYAGAPGDGNAQSSGSCSQRVLRGGSWYGRPQYARAAYRGGLAPATRNDNFGLRVARML